MIFLPKWAQVLSQRPLIAEHYCLWAGRDDCFQLYNLQSCTLCATSVQLLFEGGLHIPTLRVFLLEKPSLSGSLETSVAFFRNPVQNKCRNHRNFLHTQT